MSKSPSRDELINMEAEKIARDLIERKLNESNLPLPKDSALAFHVDKLLTLKPEILETAKARVDAKQDAYTESLHAIGLATADDKALDL